MLLEEVHDTGGNPKRDQPCRYDRRNFDEEAGRKDAGENGRQQSLSRSDHALQIESNIHLTTSTKMPLGFH